MLEARLGLLKLRCAALVSSVVAGAAVGEESGYELLDDRPQSQDTWMRTKEASASCFVRSMVALARAEV